jgi:predicted aspartyl protease
VFRSPIPGEAPLAPRFLAQGATIVHNITLATMTSEIHVDAMIDTGASICVVPPSIARALGFEPHNRLWQRPVNVVGDQVKMDMHRLQYMKVGSAKAYGVSFGVYSTFPGSLMPLVGLTFMDKFTAITFDLAGKRVVFRRGG